MAARTDDPPIRDAAALILLRETAAGPAILFGRRPAAAAFMPLRHVFPGGAVDADDASALPGDPVAGAAIRELWEETGLTLGRPAPWPDVPPAWAGFAALGLRPDSAALTPVFRAVTPPGHSRRFDARFYMAPAAALSCDPDALQPPAPELTDLEWVALSDLGRLDLALITRAVLAEVTTRLAEPGRPRPIPHFTGADEAQAARALGLDPGLSPDS